MSRFPDDYEEEFPGQTELYEANLRRALKGRRGRRFLAELREALLALPEPRLIEGAMCTVGAAPRRASLLATAEREHAESREFADRYRAEHPHSHWPEPHLDLDAVESLDAHVGRDGEGVCAGGAYIWHQRVKAGMDPAEAFASLPLLLGTHDEDGERSDQATADMLADAGRVARCVAWEIGSANDETFWKQTPEQRHAAFLAWIDKRLGTTEAVGVDA